MIEQGWVIPETPEEVSWAEQANPQINETELPASLVDPYAVRDSQPVNPPVVRSAIPQPLNEDVKKNLGRAARDGKTITENTEGKMKNDREEKKWERDAGQ